MEDTICKGCGVVLTRENAYYSNAKKSFISRCKPCYSIHRKPSIEKYAKNNPDKIKANNLRQGEKNRERNRVYAKEYHLKNRESGLEYRRQRYLTYNREEQLEKRRKWYRDNKQKHAENRTAYEEKNKDRLRAARRKWENDRLRTDINYRLHKSLAWRVRSELKGIRRKTTRTEELIGCTIEELKVFIEIQLQEGMTWDNWATNGWHIDHRIPISWFNLENENCRKLAFSYKNIQPLWGEDNLRKKNFYSHKLAS